MTFAESIKKVRVQLNLTQEELAHKLGVSFATVNRWENGSYNPSRLAKITFANFCKDNNIDSDSGDKNDK